MKKDEFLQGIYNDPLFQSVAKDISEEEKAKIDASLKAFIDQIILPMVEGFEKVMESPEAQEELKQQLRNGKKEVIKK